MDDFNVDEWLRTRGRPAEQFHVSQPYQVGCWTKSSATQGLLAYAAPALPADLNAGYPEAYTKKDANAPNGVEPVVDATVKANMLEQCDICTFRNNLNKIMLTPVELGSAWTVDACNLGSTLYLDIHQLPERSFPDADLVQYYGYKFEALCTQQSTVDASSEYAALIRLRLDKLRIVMAAEIDCFDPKVSGASDAGLSSYVELKTYQLPDSARKADNIKRYKYPKWWLQSWLAGVTKVIAGARDEQGQLQSVEVLPTHSLPKLVAQVTDFDPWLLIGFGRDVLTWMQQVTRAHPGQHIRLSYQAVGRQHAILSQVLDGGSLPVRLQACLQ